jgi:transposase-like protein
MPRKKFKPEQIISMLRQAEVELANGLAIVEVCRKLAITENTYYRWRKQYGGLQLDQVKRFKEIEKENIRLRRVVADLNLDNAILKEVAGGKY